MLRLMKPEHKLSVINKLLAVLKSADYQRLFLNLELVTLTFGEVLYESGDIIEYVYFPNDALVSLLTNVDDQHALEVGLIGGEGMVGISLALGVTTSAFRTVVQGEGTAMRIKSAYFMEELRSSLALQKLVHHYTRSLIAQISQTAACNRFHVIEARLARLLLMTRDRVFSNRFYLTHEFLANILGVRRVSITKAAHSLKKKNLIEYSRGHITITNPTGLELASCPCYALANDKQENAEINIKFQMH